MGEAFNELGADTRTSPFSRGHFVEYAQRHVFGKALSCGSIGE
jgi:hypothetical protein